MTATSASLILSVWKVIPMPKAVLSIFLVFCFAARSKANSPPTEVVPTIAQLVLEAAEEMSPDAPEVVESDEEIDRASSETKTASRNLQRIAGLEKPLAEIRLVASNTEEDRPESQAAGLLNDQPEQIIGGDDLSTFEPDRYSVPFCYRPLYFEELNLERCGNTYGCVTNLVSAFHFVTNTAALPYRLATQRADRPIPARGDCKTCQAFSHDIEPFGFESKGVLIQAAAMAGFVFLAM